MKRSLCALIIPHIVLVLSATSVVAIAPPKPLITLPASYIDLYKQILADGSKRKPAKYDAADYGDVALRLWERTHDAGDRDVAVNYFHLVLQDPKIMIDFHVLHHLGEYAWRLKRAGLLSPADEAKITTFAQQQLANFVKSEDDGDYNIRMGMVAGYAGFLKLLEGESFPGRAAAQKRLDDYWALIRQTGDLDEDASNYDCLGAAFMIDLARLAGHEDDLKAPGFHRLFERFRAMVSPAGIIPEYGDSYFNYLGMPLDRVYLLEYAAKLYNDPTFLWTARKIYRRPQSGLPDLDHWSRTMALIDMDLLDAEPQTPPGPPSTVTTRMRRGSAETFADKLILRTGLEPGAAMIMMDLYASGSHSHPNKGPSIAYFESDQVPLFHNMGRNHTRSAIAGNLVWAMPAAAGRFPGCWDRDGEWFTMRIPVSLLTRTGEEITLGKQLTLRNFQEFNHNTKTLWFDNLRFDGPAGTRMVDDFDSGEGWSPLLKKLTQVESDTSDKTQGVASQKIAWSPLPSDGFQRRFTTTPAPASVNQYDELKLDLKYEGARPMMHIRDLGQQIDLGDQSMVASPPDAGVEQRGGDAYGRIHYAHYLRDDSQLTRSIVLTPEGVLFVHDVLTPGPSMEGWNAGTLWQLYQLQDKGNDWFCSQDDGTYPPAELGVPSPQPRQMLVRFDAEPGALIQEETVKQTYYDPNPRQRKPEQFSTTYIQQKVHPEQPVEFNYVVVANNPSAGSPKDTAQSIVFDPASNAEQARVSVEESSGRPLVITIGATRWSVQR
jgi:hypothetical protein